MKNLNLKNMKTIACFCLIYLLIISTGCKPEPTPKVQPDTIFYRLSDYQLSKTPYFKNPAFDTLTFLSNNNDTLIFVKMKTDSLWNIIVNNPNPSHPGIFSYYQTLRNTYQTIKGNGKFEVRQEKKSMYSSSFEFSFNNSKFIPSEDHIGWSGFPTYKKEMIINNKSFYDIIIINTIWGDTNSNTVYINSSHGIFYFIDKKNNLNYLLN